MMGLECIVMGSDGERRSWHRLCDVGGGSMHSTGIGAAGTGGQGVWWWQGKVGVVRTRWLGRDREGQLI